MNSIDGKPVNLARYQGKVVLIVNVASQCGYTPQYAGLEELHRKYAAKGLNILGFPANEFGAQEPGSNAEIAQFCQTNYGVDFDMFSKIVVKGPGQAPLYQFLTSKQTNPKFAGDIAWNFEKFLIGQWGGDRPVPVRSRAAFRRDQRSDRKGHRAKVNLKLQL